MQRSPEDRPQEVKARDAARREGAVPEGTSNGHTGIMPAALTKGSRFSILRSLPGNKRWAYFKDQLLWRSLAVVAGAVVVMFLAIHILSPTPAPRLYVAVINDAIGTSSAQSLQRSVATDLNIPEGRRGGILVDTHFNLSSDGLSKLQTMLSNHEIDVVIADRSAFTQLAGYGYFVPMTSELTASQRNMLSGAITSFKGYDDSDHADAFYDGSGHGRSQPYGLDLTGPHTRNKLGSSTKSVFIGVAQGSRHSETARRLISYLVRE